MVPWRPLAAPVRLPLTLCVVCAWICGLFAPASARAEAPVELLPAIPPGSPAAGEGVVRSVIVVEASSSLRATDPKGQRKLAAELHVDLSRDGDEVAVVAFAGTAREVTSGFVTIRSPEDRATLKLAIRGIGTEGVWADFSAGLAAGRKLLEAAPGSPSDRELLLILGDESCDPDPRGPLGVAAQVARPHRMDAFCHEKVLKEIVPALGGAPVFAFGLSRSAPRAFLEALGRASGGLGMVAAEADDLPRFIAGIHARLRGTALMKGAPGAAIEVHDGAGSLDVALVAPRGAGARLLDPAGVEVPTHNEKPGEVLFVEGPAYRLFKVASPAVGAYRVAGGAGGRFVAVEGSSLWLEFVDAPEVAEVGKEIEVRVRLASASGELPSLAFLDRHELHLRGAQAASGELGCSGQLATVKPVLLRRGADGIYRARQAPRARGELCFQAELVPGPGGMLTRRSAPLVVRAVPRLKLVAAGMPAFAPVVQGQAVEAMLSLEGSEIAVPLEAQLSLEGGPGLSLSPASIALTAEGPRVFTLRVEADPAAEGGPRSVKLEVRPVKPKGHETRAILLEGEVTVVPLTFWERTHPWIAVGSGGLVLLLFGLGLFLPPRFGRRLVLRYEDRRAPEVPRTGTCVLRKQARAGFYRGARLLLGAAGPVRTGAVVELRPASGGGVVARPLGGKVVREIPAEDAVALGEPREVRAVVLKDGVFRCAPSARYEVIDTGLVFWIEVGR
ncbi:vWA domain-containing protein [Chondromyces crocatus]|uniref:VWFA domain-containing protein n=1 Tax=Chondromyces crocatus TaxID=52 RepID=A0A0K1EB78_CHOCO|nr:vWA domain-containing protein [Chondromyces crocatus]AKT38099.1 uncharacterized protein CMC5_022410 [Chondromyces crocatus]